MPRPTATNHPHERTASPTRGHLRRLWDVMFGGLRFVGGHFQTAYATFGIFILCGAAMAVLFTAGFAELAHHVAEGQTQAFDDTVMRFMGAHQNPMLQSVMVEFTSLGTGSLVIAIVIVAALLFWFNQHKQSAILLVVSSLGGVVLNNILKLGFNRPRPHLFVWGTSATSSSFPSGHAMGSAVVYGTVAYLTARLARNRATRMVILVSAVLLIIIICCSRMYLGVHYPSDVGAGLVIGFAWAGFCMATLEASQLYARKNAPELLRTEHPAPPAP